MVDKCLKFFGYSGSRLCLGILKNKLLLVALILVAIGIITHLYIRRMRYFKNDTFPYMGKIPCSSLNGSFVTPRKNGSQAINLVAILTYMHTISSSTGSMFQHHSRTFFFDEPLESLHESSRRNMPIRYLNGFKRQLSGYWIREDVAIKTVQNMLHCKHIQLDFDTLTKGNLSNRKEWRRNQILYFKCIENCAVPTIETIHNCLHLLTCPCLEANLRVFKFIRLPMGPVYELLMQNQNLQFVYLVRDPRALMDSEIRKSETVSRNLRKFWGETNLLCTKLHEDYMIYNSFPQKIRDRIKLVRWEDLSDSLSSVAADIFHFANVVMLEKDRKFVTQSERKGENSTQFKFDEWRTHISQEHVEIVNSLCDRVYRDFGYLKYTNIAGIRNLKRPTYSNIPSFNLE